jgi:hypothetical protein
MRRRDFSDIDFLDNARLGIDDYDFESAKLILEGGQAAVFELKSKIDGRTYAAKRLEYQIGNNFNSKKVKAVAEREIGCIR